MDSPAKNLLIVHSSGYEDISDWDEVKRRIEAQAPDIEVRIANNFARNSVTARWQIRRPSLVFCASHLAEFRPLGGTILVGHQLTKLEQCERLARQGLPTPQTLRLTPEAASTLAQWGRYVVVKPPSLAKGVRVQLVATRDVAARLEELTWNGPMLVQPYVEHSVDGCPTSYRVLTLFGRVLCCHLTRWAAPRASLDEIAASAQGTIATNSRQVGCVRELSNDAEVIAFAEQAQAAFPECAVLGVDVVRETPTGKLHILEVNPEGLTWHFSSPVARAELPAEFVRGLYTQFNALDRTAQLLIEKTRAAAS
ncbi:MAG: ATP-grasp domain-containing protein [Tardiphaga sp.]